FHARDEPLLLLLELLDLLDLLVELRDLGLEIAVALGLELDPALVMQVHGTPDQHRGRGAGAHYREVFGTTLLAQLGAPWQQVDAGHQSKLRRARPQAIMSAGASLASASARTREAAVMFANGFAIDTGVSIFD